ncbi:MAG: hypothetical protein MUF18_08360 [Fimbriiglobus sp.]|jgi:hypothetical protein|nr:hypothetical protein [Fimbriiglobus sp.]
MIRPTLAVTALVMSVAVAPAQPMPGAGPAQRPAFSPYLNLLNGGGNPGLNYLGIVRPQQQMQQQFNQLQQQTNQQTAALAQAYDSQLDTLASAFLPATGNVARFNSAPGYFGRMPFGNGIYSGGAGGMGGGFGGRGGMGMGAAGGGMGQRPAMGGGGAGAGGAGRVGGMGMGGGGVRR